MKEPSDIIEKTLFRIVSNNSPIISKDLMSKGLGEGISNEKKVYRTLDTLIKDKLIKKRSTGTNMIYYVEKGIILRPTQNLVVEAIILLELEIPKLKKLISKKINAKSVQGIIEIFTEIDKYILALSKMSKWEIPEDLTRGFKFNS